MVMVEFYFLIKSLTRTIVMVIEQLANVALGNDNPYNVFIRGKKGGLSLSDKRNICEFIFFRYKCCKVETDDCSLDSRMRLTIETCKINSPAAATGAPRIFYPCLTLSTDQRGTSNFILETIVATSSQETFKYQLLKLMPPNMMTSISSSCHLTKWIIAGFSASVSEIKTHCFQDLWVMNQTPLLL